MESPWRIGNVRLPHGTVLAPACGALNLPMRLAYKRFGAGLTCIGAIDAEAVVRSGAARLINLLGREEATCQEERPVSVQLIGSDPELIAAAAGGIEPLTSIVDLNFSSPLRSAMERGMGAGVLKDAHRIRDIVQAVVGRVTVPVTAKIRIGVAGHDVDVVGVAQACQDAGASAIVVHARSASEGYAGSAHWEFIEAVKKAVSIPVIGNGAVRSAVDAKAMVERTGCDFVMICSAAFVNPVIFLQANALLEADSLPAMHLRLGLVRFMREYFSLTRRLEGRNRRDAFKKSCRQFLKLRSFMTKLAAGEVSFPAGGVA